MSNICIELEARVSDSPVFDGIFHIPVKVEKFRIIEKTPVLQNMEKEKRDYTRTIMGTPSIDYGGEYINTALPIFNGDRMRVYIDDLGIGHIQARDAERIELLDTEGKTKAVYRKRVR